MHRAFLLLIVLACSSGPTRPDGGSAGPTSGLPAASTLPDLGDAEKGALCDWTAARSGGYGKTTTCKDGVYVKNATDQAQCIAQYLFSCKTVSVEVWEGCVNKTIEDPCALYLYSADECALVNACLKGG